MYIHVLDCRVAFTTLVFVSLVHIRVKHVRACTIRRFPGGDHGFITFKSFGEGNLNASIEMDSNQVIHNHAC